MKRIKTLHGLTVSLTGFCSRPRYELVQLIRRKHGRVIGDAARVTTGTDILVRGHSQNWKHGTFGKKEARAAELIRKGSKLCVILSEDLERLLQDRPVSEFSPVAGYDVSLLRAQADAADLDQSRLTNQRLEQGKLRALHLGAKRVAECSICARRLPANLLVVGHIKQRARCSVNEKRDLPNIAMAICLLGCDVLYERGFIAVSPKGRIVVTSHVLGSPELSRALARLSGRHCRAHSPATEPYFAWHRVNAFMGSDRA
jgi:hypothetical protein